MNQKILIIKIGAIGDIIMSLSMLKYLRDISPEMKIYWVCGESVGSLIKFIDDKVIIIPVSEKKLFNKNKLISILELLKLQSRIALRKFDKIIIGYKDFRYKLLTLLCITKEKAIFSSKEYLPVNGISHYIGYQKLAGNKSQHSFSFPYPVFNIEQVKMKYSLTNIPYIVLAPGGAKNYLRDDSLRRWPITNYKGLILELNKLDYEVIIIGSSSDQWVEEQLNGCNFKSYIGKLSLLETLELCSASEIVITHDSGPFHISILSGAPTLGLFGPVNPSERVPPFNHKVYTLWGGKNLSCRPCYDGKNFAPCTNNFCMQDITIDLVLEKTLNILKKS